MEWNGFTLIHLVMTNLRTLDEAAARRSTQLLRHFLTLGHRVKLGLGLPGDGADLPGPLLAVLLGGVATDGLHTLLLLHRLAVGHVVLHQVRVVLGPALADVLGPAHLRARQVAVLGQQGCLLVALSGITNGCCQGQVRAFSLAWDTTQQRSAHPAVGGEGGHTAFWAQV